MAQEETRNRVPRSWEHDTSWTMAIYSMSIQITCAHAVIEMSEASQVLSIQSAGPCSCNSPALCKYPEMLLAPLQMWLI